MTGALNIGNSSQTQIWLNSSGTSETGIGLKVDGATLGWVGYNAYKGTGLYTYDGDHYLGIYPNGTPRFDGNVIWHQGNDGSGSGLDADLLDGKHRNEILRYESNPTSETSLDNRVILDGIDMFDWDYAHAPNVAGQPSGDGAASAAMVVFRYITTTKTPTCFITVRIIPAMDGRHGDSSRSLIPTSHLPPSSRPPARFGGRASTEAAMSAETCRG